jgi:hypothetical protein
MAPNKENEDGYLTRAANYRLFWRWYDSLCQLKRANS